MAKLVLSRDGKVVNHYFLDKPSFSIGRNADNDIALDDALLDATEFSVIKVGNDAIVEGATGTGKARVNGKPLARQILQHLDVIDLGKYQLRYMSSGTVSDADFDRTMLIQTVRSPDAGGAPVVLGTRSAATEKVKLREGSVEFLSGPAAWTAGKIIPLERVVTTFGDPGEKLIVLTRRPHGIFVSHVEGPKLPRVNGETITSPQVLKVGDLIEGAGYKLKLAS